MDFRPFHIQQAISTSESDNADNPSIAPVSLTSTVQELLDYISAKAEEGRPNPCPQCGTGGTIPIPVDADNDPSRCPLCTGWGYTDILYKLVGTYVPA